MKNYSESSYIRAKERVKDLREFYGSLLAYCIVIPLLWYINYEYFHYIWWAIFPTLGWGLGLAFHAYRVFVRNAILGKQWEERKIQEFMDREDF